MKLSKKDIEEFFNKLIKKGLISKEDILFDDVEFNLNKDELIKICETGSDIRLDDSGTNLEYMKDNVWHACPTMETGVENAAFFLTDRIPQYTWNTDEEDSSTVNNEIESIYTCTVIAGIFKEDFKDEYLEILNSYDEEGIKSGHIGQGSFTYLLNEWKSLQSRVIQAVCSACKENISTKKEQYSSLNLSTLEKEERIKLRDLKTEVKIYFNEFKRTKLNSEVTKNLKKHELYQLYDERDTYIKEKIINSSKYSSVRILYFLDKLNFENVPLLVKKKISNASKLEVKELFENKVISNELRDEYKNKFLRKGIKVFLRKWKNDELTKYLEDRPNYKLPSF